MAGGRQPLIGRSAEAAELQRLVATPGKRLVWVSGPRGAGKTTLAAEVFASHRDSELVMDYVGATLGHGRNLTELLAQLMSDLGGLPNDVSHAATLAEQIAARAEHVGRGLYFIDNVETEVFDSRDFHEFATRWIDGRHAVCLLLTLRTSSIGSLRAISEHQAVHEFELEGLRDPAAILELLGDRAVHSYGRARLLRVAKELDNLPQRLLQLRWSGEEPEAYLERVRHPDRQRAAEPLRAVLAEADLESFCACLGLLQSIEFEGTLLEELWAAGLGSERSSLADAETFLLDQRILGSASTRENAYRLHPTVLGDLAQLAEQRDRSWASRVHKVMAGHYAIQMETPGGVEARGALRFVHHALRVGREPEVWDMLFSDHGLEQWRREGRSLDASSVLAEFWQFVQERASLYSSHDRAELLLRRAHVASDLGEPRECLRMLDEALRESEADKSPQAASTRRAIWTQLAISHAGLGHTPECISYYVRVIEADPDVIDPRTALCMGYVAYEYCDLLEFGKADSWSRLALQRCSRKRDPSIFAKNLCNRGLVQLLRGDVADAAATFQAAVELVSAPESGGFDVREHGRVLAHLGMATLATPDCAPAEALAQLTEARRLNQEAGDRRRVFVSMGRIGIAHIRLGDVARGCDMLIAAARGHLDMGDARNLAVEVLALAEVREQLRRPPDPGKAYVFPLSAPPPIPPELEGILSSVRPGGALERYSAIWDRAYRRMLVP